MSTIKSGGNGMLQQARAMLSRLVFNDVFTQTIISTALFSVRLLKT